MTRIVITSEFHPWKIGKAFADAHKLFIGVEAAWYSETVHILKEQTGNFIWNLFA